MSGISSLDLLHEAMNEIVPPDLYPQGVIPIPTQKIAGAQKRSIFSVSLRVTHQIPAAATRNATFDQVFAGSATHEHSVSSHHFTFGSPPHCRSGTQGHSGFNTFGYSSKWLMGV